MIEPLATLFTLIFFSTNFIDLAEFKSQKSTGRNSIIPWLSQLINCALWLKYGFLLHQTTIVVVNFTGLLISGVSIYYFYYYTHQKDAIEDQIQYSIYVLVIILGYVKICYSEAVVEQLGFITALFGIIMFGSPLVNLKNVIRHRSTKGYISLPMSSLGLLVCILWTAFGIQLSDPFIIVPNGSGAILNGVQLCLYFYYSKKSEGFLPLRYVE